MWIEITKEEYGKLFAENDTPDKLHVFGSETDMDGYYHGGKQYIMTEWGKEDEDDPLLKFVSHGGEEKFYKFEVEYQECISCGGEFPQSSIDCDGRCKRCSNAYNEVDTELDCHSDDNWACGTLEVDT